MQLRRSGLDYYGIFAWFLIGYSTHTRLSGLVLHTHYCNGLGWRLVGGCIHRLGIKYSVERGACQ